MTNDFDLIMKYLTNMIYEFLILRFTSLFMIALHDKMIALQLILAR